MLATGLQVAGYALIVGGVISMLIIPPLALRTYRRTAARLRGTTRNGVLRVIAGESMAVFAIGLGLSSVLVEGSVPSQRVVLTVAVSGFVAWILATAAAAFLQQQDARTRFHEQNQHDHGSDPSENRPLSSG